MAKILTKASKIFGVPSLEVARAVDDSDKIAAFTAAHFRLQARMRELEGQFETKASLLRTTFLCEVTEISDCADTEA